MPKRLNVGIIGLGHWGPNILRNMAEHDRIGVNWVCDVSGEALDKFQHLYPANCRISRNASEVIGDPALDAVVIVTPASTHYSLAKQALLAGKHVLCEKPLTIRSDHARELVELAEAKNLKLMVGHTFLFNDAIDKLKDLVDHEVLGRIYYITANRTHLGLIRRDVDVLWDLAPHDVATMIHVLGERVERVSAVSSSPLGSNNADVAFLHLFFPSGVMCQIHASWVDSNKVRQMNVIGSEARVLFDDLNNLEPIRVFQKGIGLHQTAAPDFGEFRYIQRDGDIISPKIIMREPLRRLIDAFVWHVADGEPCASDGRLGLEVVRVLEAATLSIASHGAPIAVPGN